MGLGTDDGTDDGDAKRFLRLVQRQQVAIILQQHGGLRADLSPDIEGRRNGQKYGVMMSANLGLICVQMYNEP